MLSDILKWGGKRLESGPTGAARSASVQADEPVVGSKAFPKFLAALTARPSPVLLDFGPVIGTNVEFFGERLGCKLHIEDLIGDLDRHTKAGTLDALPAALETRFRHADASVDGILCWDVFDFLDKKAAEVLARQVTRMLRPGGAVMGLFATAAKSDHTSFTKYEIVDDASFRHRQHPGVGGVKRAIQNRDIIRMFEGLTVSDSFLLKSNIREMLLRKR
ncbi:MAG TPA: class I SAM-dependent methyltransferase [Vicinamibacterales bacterium]|nr:class I SAM-dependent methyltransferase [Vicinamibacterales bacterium]